MYIEVNRDCGMAVRVHDNAFALFSSIDRRDYDPFGVRMLFRAPFGYFFVGETPTTNGAVGTTPIDIA